MISIKMPDHIPNEFYSECSIICIVSLLFTIIFHCFFDSLYTFLEKRHDAKIPPHAHYADRSLNYSNIPLAFVCRCFKFIVEYSFLLIPLLFITLLFYSKPHDDLKTQTLVL